MNNNPHRGEVALQVGDAAYTLCYSVNSLCVLEEKLDKSVSKIIEMLGEGKDIKLGLVRDIVWAGLLDKQKDITTDQVGELISEAGLPLIMQKVGEAMAKAFPSAEAKAADANPKGQKR